MARDVIDSAAIETRDDLVTWFEKGCKARSAFRLGTEHEKVPFYRADTTPVPYERTASRSGGIRDLLEGLQARLKWEPISDGAALIGLAAPDAGAAISLEPGGQFELSGAPVETCTRRRPKRMSTCARSSTSAKISRSAFWASASRRSGALDEVPRMPKKRYQVMTRYMPTVGSRGLDMMYRTATVQVNLDFGPKPTW